jgi:hypothetical protein
LPTRRSATDDLRHRVGNISTREPQALRFGRRVRVGTVRRNSHWIANVDATPSAAVWLDGSRRSGRATVDHEGFIDAASIEVEPVGEAGST